jgi:hypothetical protein
MDRALPESGAEFGSRDLERLERGRPPSSVEPGGDEYPGGGAKGKREEVALDGKRVEDESISIALFV